MTRIPLIAPALLFSTVAMAGYGASSEKKDSRFGEGAFAITKAIDNDPATSWQADPEKDNIGQWLTIDVPTSSVDKVALVNGWGKSDETYKDYPRVKAATIEVFSKTLGGDPVKVGEEKITLKDDKAWQVVDLKDLKIDGELGGTVKLTIDEVYPGVDYPNVAVGELRVHLTEFAAETAALVEDPEAADDDHVAPNLLDGNPRTYFAAKGDTVTMQAKATGYGLSSVGLQAGPATHARPKTVVLKANDAEVKHVIPEDAKGMQWLLLPAIIGYTGSAWGDVTIEVMDTWPGTKPDMGLALAELKLNASTIDDF
jgi:hypothetical protein